VKKENLLLQQIYTYDMFIPSLSPNHVILFFDLQFTLITPNMLVLHLVTLYSYLSTLLPFFYMNIRLIVEKLIAVSFKIFMIRAFTYLVIPPSHLKALFSYYSGFEKFSAFIITLL
jgi:hypothetical protein